MDDRISDAPQLALIRTAAVGTEFYDRVIDRIANRARKPRGILLHFAGTGAGELFVMTLYRDALARTDMFSDFTGPEIANELRDSGKRTDITRHELELHRLLVADTLEPGSERPIREPKSALFVVDPAMTPAIYLKATELANFPESWPEGLDLHMVFSYGKNMGVIDIWSSRELAEPHYRDAIAPSTEISLGAALPEGQFQNGWIELHSLSVNLPLDDPLRAFTNLESDESS